MLSEFLFGDDFSRGLAEEVPLLFIEALCCFKFASGEVGVIALISPLTVPSVKIRWHAVATRQKGRLNAGTPRDLSIATPRI